MLKGDAIKAYFFAIANGRRRRCSIFRLIINGEVVADPAIIQNHIYSFFSSLLSAVPSSGFRIFPNMWSPDARISVEDNAALMVPLSPEEINEVVSSSNSNSAPGPDGFSITFFKKFWSVLKHLVYVIIIGFCLGMVDISRLNYAIISLVPKVKGADSIRLYRPIALINNIAKFPSKGFAAHLSPVAHKVIGQQQSAFIKGRFILDGVLSLHEIVHDLRVRQCNAVILKLDYEKAYDSVSWPFLRDVLLAKGFDVAYVQRIMQLACGGHAAISVNGVVGPYFKNGRGLRQGDPISPLLFNFVVDVFSCILNRAAGWVICLMLFLI